MTTPNYGFPFPTLGDVPNGPEAVENLADAVDTELFRVEGAGKVRMAYISRPTTDNFAAGSFINMGVNTTITAAPHGVYLLSWSLILTCSASAAIGYTRVMVNSTNLTSDHRADKIAGEMKIVSNAVPFLFTGEGGPDLALQPQFQFSAGTGSIHAGSTSAIAYLGPAAA